MNAPVPNLEASWEFLQRFHPGRPVVITGISLDKKQIPTETFSPDQRGEFLKWVEACAAMPANIYFSVGEPMKAATKKLDRTDIKAVHYLHVDIDPRDGQDITQEQARILALLRTPNGLPLPTGIVYSGGGYQAYWKLSEPLRVDGVLEVAEDIKLYNLQIERTLGADHCHDISRIMRVPGTINLPDAKKVKKGRVPALAKLIEWHEDRVYEIGQFTKAVPDRPEVGVGAGAVPKVKAPSEVRRLDSVDDAVMQGVPNGVKVCIVNGCNPDDPNHFESRSEMLFWVVCELIRAGIDTDTIYSIITDPEFRISDSILDKGSGAERYALRQIERASIAIEDEDVQFVVDEKGNVLQTPHNVRVSIRRQGVTLWWDEFSDRKFVEGLQGFGPHLDDKAMIRLWLNAQEMFRLKSGKDFFHDVASDYALTHRRHPVREYIESVAETWDGTPRVDSWLIDFAGAEDTAYIRAVARLSLVAAVRRVLSPGCKFDEMVILEGPQGGGKSSLLRYLCPDETWFSDDLPLDGDAKRFIESTRGKWIVEAGELKGIRKAEADALKAALSRQIDRARLSYAREPVEVPRQCVIFGTTNADRYLKDSTGNRRYWPVRCGAIRVAGMSRVVDQLWAEAASLEARGESIRLDPSLYADATAAQGERQQSDPFMEALEPVLDGVVGVLRADDAWKVVGKPDVGTRSQVDNDRLGAVMRELGWDRTRVRIDGQRPYCYARGTAHQRQQPLMVDYTGKGAWRITPKAGGSGDDHGVF